MIRSDGGNAAESAQAEKLSIDKIIDLIRNLRNNLIKDFLDPHNLQTYYAEHFGKPLSNIKREFISRDLRELMIAPVDLVHYSNLITQIRDTNSASLSNGNHKLFYTEIEKVLEKYRH